MARTGRPKAVLQLSEEERATLRSWARSATTAPALAARSRIVLACAEGASNTQVAARLGVSNATVGKWRRRFVESRLEGLVDEPRPGQPRKITDEHAADVIAKTLESEPPDGSDEWSTRQMAAATGLSQTAVSRIWRAFGLQPRHQRGWTRSKDPLLVERLRDIVGLYVDPPERAVVLCMDPTSRIPARDRSPSPMRPPAPAGMRGDTTSLFAALRLAHGKSIGSLHARRRASEFRRFLTALDREVPDRLEIHLMLDNSFTHKSAEVKRWLLAHPRFVIHLTPTGTSWLDLVERWFGELTTIMLAGDAYRSIGALNTDLRAWLSHWNVDPRPYAWIKDADQIRAAITRNMTEVDDSRR